MADYHIWHPSYQPGQTATLDAFVTLGEAFYLNRGTDEVIGDLLVALAIDASVTGWRFSAVRTHYFGSYRESSDAWNEKWKTAFRAQVELEKSVPLPAEPGHGYFDLDTTDATYLSTEDPDTWAEWTCVVIATARDLDHLADLKTIVAGAFPAASTVVVQAFNGYPQLRCDLGPHPRSFYEAGAASAEALLDQLDAAGASTRFHTRP